MQAIVTIRFTIVNTHQNFFNLNQKLYCLKPVFKPPQKSNFQMDFFILKLKKTAAIRTMSTAEADISNVSIAKFNSFKNSSVSQKN